MDKYEALKILLELDLTVENIHGGYCKKYLTNGRYFWVHQTVSRSTQTFPSFEEMAASFFAECEMDW